MRAVLALTWARPGASLLRGTDGRGGRAQVTTTALAVLAFAIATALTLSVIGGLMAFMERAEDPPAPLGGDDAGTYVILAWVAVVLLCVPLLSLGGAAARLGVAQRDARLSTLRLLGVTPREVVGLTLVETARQGLLGAALGVVGYLALLPVWTGLTFQGQRLGVGELWVGPGPLLAALVVVPAVAAVSGAVSLRRVVVSPLGVARRQSPPAMHWVRALVVVVALGAVGVVAQVGGGIDGAVFLVILLGLLAMVFLALNLLGPWTIGLLARVMARRARTPARLLAARRLLDDPRGAWRVVGGLGLASFVAGILSVVPTMLADDGMQNDPVGRLLWQDVLTGALLTLGIAFILAATSAGIMQAASVLDRRREYALQQLAGVPVELFDAVRRHEVIAPLVFVAGTSAAAALLFVVPILGLATATDLTGLIALAGCLLVGGLLVIGATEASRPLLRSVLADTVVRPD
ncbi:FtsX-like permease family protein [Actinotalea sp. K2]|uniref:FtsX-like permease family protein n=1 Tax=Actinotalea sp. K2 TaxID=2939438 RepID=UPI002017E68B|nr:FtsX-like permease family protein [Actinotalea sp. K2]MCL3859597.1 hypothetical protein [Actinotalea sp. K2]